MLCYGCGHTMKARQLKLTAFEGQSQNPRFKTLKLKRAEKKQTLSVIKLRNMDAYVQKGSRQAGKRHQERAGNSKSRKLNRKWRPVEKYSVQKQQEVPKMSTR